MLHNIEAPYGNRKSLSHRLIRGCILLIAVVLPIVYTENYMSQLAVHHYQPLVKSIEDVAANPDIKVYTTKGFPVAAYIMVLNYYEKILFIERNYTISDDATKGSYIWSS